MSDCEILKAEPYVPKGVSLATINTWLRKIGLLLVVEAMVKSRKDMPPVYSRTRLWIETTRRYEGRCAAEKGDTCQKQC